MQYTIICSMTMYCPHVINDLFSDLEVPFTTDLCDNIYGIIWIGIRYKRVTRPRPIVIQLSLQRLKGDVFRCVNKLRNLPKWKGITVADDRSQEQQSRQSDLCAVHTLARLNGLTTRIKGDRLVIDETSYMHSQLNQLPHDLSLSKAKTVRVRGRIAFQGKHLYLSNFYQAQFEYQNAVYQNAEQCYQHINAIANNNACLAAKILASSDPVVVKSYGKQIQESRVWKERQFDTLEDIVTAKFVQNPGLKNQLVATGNLTLYEATTDRVYGCGLSLFQRDRIGVNNPGQNKFGQLLETVLRNLSGE